MKAGLAVFGLLLFLFGIHIVNGALANPGTDADPIVAKSYVDEKFTQSQQQVQTLQQQVQTMQQQAQTLQQQVQTLQQQLAGLPSGSGSGQYAVLNLKAGQKLLTGENTEIIVRTGTCKAISGTQGNMADLTSDNANDLPAGTAIPNNHLIFSSRQDGRGILTESAESWVVVRGTYTLP